MTLKRHKILQIPLSLIEKRELEAYCENIKLKPTVWARYLMFKAIRKINKEENDD